MSITREPSHTVLCLINFNLPVPTVRYLLKNNVGPDLCNEDGLTALHQVRHTTHTVLSVLSPACFCFLNGSSET